MIWHKELKVVALFFTYSLKIWKTFLPTQEKGDYLFVVSPTSFVSAVWIVHVTFRYHIREHCSPNFFLFPQLLLSPEKFVSAYNRNVNFVSLKICFYSQTLKSHCRPALPLLCSLLLSIYETQIKTSSFFLAQFLRHVSCETSSEPDVCCVTTEWSLPPISCDSYTRFHLGKNSGRLIFRDPPVLEPFTLNAAMFAGFFFVACSIVSASRILLIATHKYASNNITGKCSWQNR